VEKLDIDVNNIFGRIRDRIALESEADAENYLPNIIEFCESNRYLNLPDSGIRLFPMQRVILKIFYRGQKGNEHLKLTEDELKLLIDYKMDKVIAKYRSEHLFRELVLVLGRRCISGDTLIFDAVTGENRSVEDWYKDSKHLSVWTYNEENKQFEINKAEIIEQGIRECFRVTVDNGDYVDCTDNHPLLTPNGWKQLNDLKVGDLIAQADDIPKTDDGEGLEEHEAAILGYIIGDGNCTMARAYFTCNDQQVIEHLQECLDKLSDNMIVQYDNNTLSPYQYSLRQKNIKYRTYIKNGKSVTHRSVSDLCRFLIKHGLQGKTAKQKRVPQAVFSASSRVKSAFLKAYFSCDGYMSPRNKNGNARIELYSVNQGLLEDVHELLISLGIYSKVREKRTKYIEIIDNGKTYRYPNHLSYRLSIERNYDVCRFSKYIGAFKNYDTNVAQFITEELHFVKIQNISSIGTKQTYDICIYNSGSGSHNFIISNGLQMHNSGKDFLTSIIALYEAMKLLECPTGSPFIYYGLASGNPIYILTIATSGDQAHILFNEMKARIHTSEYFRSKVGKIEIDKMWLLTPEDRKHNKKLVESGQDNIQTPGSVVIMSGHSNSESLLGKRIFALLLDEVASFKSATASSSSGDRIYSALAPATSDFKIPGKTYLNEQGKELPFYDSKIISISSPRSEEGILYKLYREAPDSPSRLAFKLPTWKVNLQFDEDSLRSEFKFINDTEFAMEFGAEFSGTAGEKFIPNKYVDEAVDLGRKMLLTQKMHGYPGQVYFAHLDPATRSHNYALVILHIEERIRATERNGLHVKEKIKLFVVDHLKFWQPTVDDSIKINDVDQYIIRLARLFRFAMVSFDDFNSTASMQKIRAKGIPTRITSFRKQYKIKIYDTLEQLLINHQLVLPYKGDCATQLTGELKCLKRIYTPIGFKIKPDPESNFPTDDMVDALAGAIGSSSESVYTGYPKSSTVNMPQFREDLSHKWNIGRGSYPNNTWNDISRKFGKLNPYGG
jgi:intein/homing endonuclease